MILLSGSQVAIDGADSVDKSLNLVYHQHVISP